MVYVPGDDEARDQEKQIHTEKSAGKNGLINVENKNSHDRDTANTVQRLQIHTQPRLDRRVKAKFPKPVNET